MPAKCKFTNAYRKVEPYREMALKTLQDLISINSVYDKESISDTTPFGKGVEECLSYMANWGKDNGFKVDRCDNYCTELSVGNSTEKIFDIYAHCDVVPVKADDWSNDPFNPVVKDGKIIARGASDDKGPLVASLVALLALKENKLLRDDIQFRFIIGGNEERDSLCLKHYFDVLKKPYPTYGISPDDEFPLIYGEKSIYNVTLKLPIDIPNVESFSFGTALNVVIDQAQVKFDNELDKQIISLIEDYKSTHRDINIVFENNELIVYGKPAHGSTPYLGVNAGLHMINILGKLFNLNSLCNIYNNFISTTGKEFNCSFSDIDFDCSTYNVGLINYSNGYLDLSVNFRFPPKVDPSLIMLNMSKIDNFQITSVSGSKGYVLDKNSKFIKTLLKTYSDETGDKKSKIYARGGGTYARESKNTIPFGAQFPLCDTRMHGIDEFIYLDDFYTAMQIYYQAYLNVMSIM